jgi:non-ribosomal peptide synthase protein (TIGR01720 family)
MVPSTFVPLDALPLSPNGKINRQALPAPEGLRLEPQTRYAPPRTAPEQVLTQIWTDLLRVERVGVHDNFFELGGDSIISLQAIVRAKRAGIHLTPKQLFQHPTIAELAEAAGRSGIVDAEQRAIAGDVSLTPIQCWFFEQGFTRPDYYNQSLLLEVAETLDRDALTQAVAALLQHHDALRLRYRFASGAWHQRYEIDEGVSFHGEDLSSLGEQDQAQALRRSAEQVQASLDLERGPVFRVVHYDLGPPRRARLLLTAHHLVVDGVSWRILLDDLQTVYGQLTRHEAVELPPKTTSFQRWAARLADYAQSSALADELPYWRDDARRSVRPLPLDLPQGENTVASTRTIHVHLAEEETRVLLQDVPQTYHTQVNDVLISALSRAFHRWCGDPHLLLDLEGHGREDIVADVDVTRTVGWFTTVFPILVRCVPGDAPDAALHDVKEQLRRIPARGIGYGLLRHLKRDDPVNRALATLPPAQVSFNYMGQLDQALGDRKLFRFAKESSGPNQDPSELRSYVLDVSGRLVDGRLWVGWAYSQHLHHAGTIENLSALFLAELRALVECCRSRMAGQYTTADFPLANLKEATLSKLSALVNEAES